MFEINFYTILTMDRQTLTKIFNIFSIVCGVWFACTSWLWVWFINLLISLPVGIIGMIFWYFGKREGTNRLNRIALITHVIGLVVAILSLIILLIKNWVQCRWYFM